MCTSTRVYLYQSPRGLNLGLHLPRSSGSTPPSVYIYQGLPGPPHSSPTLPRSTATRVHLNQDQHPPVSKSTMVCRTYLRDLPRSSGSTTPSVYIHQGLPGPPHSCPTLPRSTATRVHLYWVLGPPVSKSTRVCMTYLRHLPGFSGSTSTRVSRGHPTRALHFLDLQLLLSTSTQSSAHQCLDLSWPARSTWDSYRGF